MRFLEIRGLDNTVIIDGVCLKMDFKLNKGYATVYFDVKASSGWVEYTNGKGHVIDNLDEFSDIVHDFDAKINNLKKTDYSLRIVPDDKSVMINDIVLEFDFDIDANYHAVHWDGEKGFIETRNGLNLTLVDIDEFSDIIEAYAAKAKEIDDEKVEKEAERAKPENVAKRKIIALEREITPRRMREAMLTDDGKTWLAAKEAEIQAIRDTI